MLQHEQRENEVEASVREQLQVGSLVVVKPDAASITIERLRLLDHGGSEVDAIATVEVLCQCPCQAPDTAAEVERSPPLDRHLVF